MDKLKCLNNNHSSWETCWKTFVTLEVPRNSNTILNAPTSELSKLYPCELCEFKVLMIRLRRACDLIENRQIGAKNNVSSDWSRFIEIHSKNSDQYLNRFDCRWLISILDTYIDYGTIAESKNAMLATSLVNYEKFAITESLCVHNRSDRFPIIQSKIFNRTQKPIWSGLKTIQLSNDDFPTNFFKRYANTLKDTPIILKIYNKLMKVMINDSRSTINIIMKSSPKIEARIKDEFK